MDPALASAPPESRPELSVSALRVTFGSTVALDDVSASFESGLTALVGPNGAGKSTLMRVLCGVARPQAGHVEFRGRPLTLKVRRELRRNLGYLPQNPTWHSWMTVQDVVSSFAWMHGVDTSDIPRHVGDALATVGLERRSQVKAGALSGGQFQRLMLAASVVHRPALLVLDEPSVGLDPAQRQQLRSILHDYSREHVVVLSTHLLDDVATTAGRIVALRQGRVVFDGAPNTLVDEYSSSDLGHATALESAYIRLVSGGGPGAPNAS